MLLNAKFSASQNVLDAKFKNLQIVTSSEKADVYDGPYEVTPKVESQTMHTAQKYMAENVRIKSIPFFETSNESDGKTVYIGSEVEIYGV